MGAMPHVETTALAIAMDLADMAANHPVPKVAETHPQQWETANATAVVIYASVVLAIAKELAKEVAVLALQEDNLYLGWEVLTILHFPTFLNSNYYGKKTYIDLLVFVCCCGSKSTTNHLLSYL